jgi:hypothetical protein
MPTLSPRHWENHILSMIHRKKIKEENKLKKGGRELSPMKIHGYNTW